MFCGLPNNSKCEWQKLKYFIQFCNQEFKLGLELYKCLDVMSRNRPEPEMELLDERGRSYVIEHKNLIWPENKMAYSKRENIFFDCVNNYEQYIKSGKYVLEIYVLLNTSYKNIETYAKRILNTIRNNWQQFEYEGCLLNKKKGWCFYNLDEFGNYFDDPLYNDGINVIYNSPVPETRRIDSYDKELYEVAMTVKKVIVDVEKKFINYSNSTKILIFKNFTETIFTEEFKNIIDEIEIPSYINQIWFENQEWLNDIKWFHKYTLVYGTVSNI